MSASAPSPFRPPRLVRLIHSALALKPKTVKHYKWNENDSYSICYSMPSSTLSYSRKFGSYCRKYQPARPPSHTKSTGTAGALALAGNTQHAAGVRPAAGRGESNPLHQQSRHHTLVRLPATPRRQWHARQSAAD